MKLRTKVFLAIGFAWLLCFIVPMIYLIYETNLFTDAVALARHFTTFTFLLIASMITYIILTFIIINRLIIQPLNQLQKDIKSLNSADKSELDAHGIGNEIYELLHNIDNVLLHLPQNPSLYIKAKKLEDGQKHELHEQLKKQASDKNEYDKHKNNLVRLAQYDTLTSLPNRVFFNEILNKAINIAKRHNKILAILFIGLDNFDKFNESEGQQTGDLVIKELSNRMTGILRAGDIIARLEGDEFIILLNDISNPKYASPVAEKILSLCTKPMSINDLEMTFTASIGVAVYPIDGSSLEELEKHADSAMSTARKMGGNSYQYYHNELDAQAHAHFKLDSQLKKALSLNQFSLYYQPQLSLVTGEIKGVEALIRWQHPDLGMINPDSFIPLAEESGLIFDIGRWALENACKMIKTWQDEGYEPISVAVNISARQLQQPNTVDIIAQILKDNGLDPRWLELEITESSIMENVESAIHKLQQISDMGVRIAIDDFGTGYTSINYLKKLPIHVLKIDQSFVKGLPQTQNDIAIVRAIIDLAHNLGLEVIAEGVETNEQIKFLAENNCDLIQGYFLSRPLPSNKIILQFNKLNHSSKSTTD